MDLSALDPCQAIQLWALNLSFTDLKANTSLVALYCSCTESVDRCLGICANPDLAGVGVRIAFYAQSVMNALLVFFSPRDSIPSAWAATCLVTAVIIPAIVQKFGVAGPQITLHHATLVFNFATLSCLSSLAVAPKLPIWRLQPRDAVHGIAHQPTLDITVSRPLSCSQQQPSYVPSASKITAYIVDPGWDTSFFRRAYQGDHEHNDGSESSELVFDLNQRTERIIKRRQDRQRIILSLALLLQVTLQWGWGIILFVSSTYKQTECSGTTQLWLFFRSYETAILQHSNDRKAHISALWPIWIMFCLCLTMFWTLMLACSGPSQAHDVLSRTSSRSSLHHRRNNLKGMSTRQNIYRRISTFLKLSPKRVVLWFSNPGVTVSKDQALIVANYLAAFFLWLMFVVVSELQIQINDIFDGEDDWNGFGQVAALLLALAPLWNLIEALSIYIKKERRNVHSKKRYRNIRQSFRTGSDSTNGWTDFSIQRSGITESMSESREQPGFQMAHYNHQLSSSEFSMVSATAPLLADRIPRTDSTWSSTMIRQWDEVAL